MDTANASASRAAFIASLLPGDHLAPSFTQNDAQALTRLINQTANICSARNIQLCKTCIINHILPSPGRTAALFKYLLALSRSCRPRLANERRADTSPDANGLEGLQSVSGQITPQKSAYRRLHIIYLLHDVLSSFHRWSTDGQAPQHYRHLDLRFIVGLIKDQLTRLFRLASCRGEYSADEVSPQLLKLTESWQRLGVFGDEELERLKDVARSTKERTWDHALEECNLEDEKRATEQKQAREEATRWLLPLQHGVKDDRDASWHELPAGNGLYLRQTRGFPLRAAAFPRGGFEVNSGGQEADADLQKDILWLHKEMLHCFDDYTEPEDLQDIDMLGNKIWKDPERPTRNYWGFTYDGIDRMKENSKRFRDSAIGYGGIAPLMQDPNSIDDVDSAVSRARALAGGRGGSDRGIGRGRGGRGNWRGPPRGSNGYRGGMPGRF